MTIHYESGTFTATAALNPHIPVAVDATATATATAFLDPHTIHNLTAALSVTATGVFWYSSQRSVPANKFMYETDGTNVFYLRSKGTWVDYPMTSAEIRQLNGWGTGRYPHDDAYESYQYRFIFPELRDIKYAYFGTHIDGWVGGDPTYRFFWSADTTNGDDGTWTQVTVNTSTDVLYLTYNQKRNLAYANYLNLTGVRGVKLFIDHTLSLWFGEGGRPHQIHFYGSRGQANRLAIWHPTENREVSGHHFDWENFNYGEDTRQFRVKNLSPTKRAQNIQVVMDTTGDPWTPAMNTYHSLYNGATWGSAISIDALDANGISPIYTLKRSFYGTSPTWFTMRLVATAQTWLTYIHNTTSILYSYASAVGSPMRAKNSTVALDATAFVTDGALYRNSSTYADGWSYRGSRTTQAHVTTATFTAGPKGDDYSDFYADEYGNDGLFANRS